jgi:tetratricopeptide (TPR) repeat protein
MTTRQVFFVIALAAGAVVFLGFMLYERLSPTQRALKRARRGDASGARTDIEALVLQKPASGAAHGALGQVHLLEHHYSEAAAELRKALDLGSRSATHCGALGWALVGLEQFDEALPIAEEANKKAREDFEVYCLYCGLMAHHGRGAEVAQLFEFLKRTSVQIQKLNAKNYERGLRAKFEFARDKMNAAGFV